MVWKDFNKIYRRELDRLKLVEMRTSDGKTLLLGSMRPVWGIFPRPQPKIIGQIVEKPRQEGEKTTGTFRVGGGLDGPVWELAGAIEKELGVESEVIMSPFWPRKG